MKHFVHIGTDPEFFVLNNGRLEEFPVNAGIPPVIFRKKGILNPLRVFDGRHYVFYEDNDGYIIHEDGAAFEMTTPPFNSLIEAKNSVTVKLEEAGEKLGVDFQLLPTVDFYIPKEYKNDKEFLKACEFGCNPDLDGYVPDLNLTTVTISAEEIPYRFGGGHIMIEFPHNMKEYFEKWHKIFSQFLAITVGTRMIAFSKKPDLIKLRAKYYGLPAKYRPDKIDNYLFEYRTPSNEWLTFSGSQLEEIENGINVALTLFYERGKRAKEFLSRFIESAAISIMEVDVFVAKNILLPAIREAEKEILEG